LITEKEEIPGVREPKGGFGYRDGEKCLCSVTKECGWLLWRRILTGGGNIRVRFITEKEEIPGVREPKGGFGYRDGEKCL
jgi:hypothetical protein